MRPHSANNSRTPTTESKGKFLYLLNPIYGWGILTSCSHESKGKFPYLHNR